MGQAKQRGTYEERVAKAQMPSFIVQIVADKDNTLSYDKTGLLDSQIGFADTCLKQLQSQIQPNQKNIAGVVYWGNNKDFIGHIGAYKSPQDIDTGWRMYKDMFFTHFWATTNQAIDISKEFCDEVVSGTKPQPIGIKLDAVAKHEYTNFAVAVAWTKHNLTIAKMSMGDLCPPEADPNSTLYNPNFVSLVKQALSNFGINAKLDWQPGRMISEEA